MPHIRSNPPPASTLSPDFFNRDTVLVAQELLGQILVCRDPKTEEPIFCRIVETEAYKGDSDPACHAYGKTTGRAATLYKAPGLAYVYLIYGMYHCLNVVTEPEGIAGAVLFRALEPVIPAHQAQYKTHGPGRLTRALGITKTQHNEISLTSNASDLYLQAGAPIPPDNIVQTTRIGIRQGIDLPWRFYIAGNKWVSVR